MTHVANRIETASIPKVFKTWVGIALFCVINFVRAEPAALEAKVAELNKLKSQLQSAYSEEAHLRKTLEDQAARVKLLRRSKDGFSKAYKLEQVLQASQETAKLMSLKNLAIEALKASVELSRQACIYEIDLAINNATQGFKSSSEQGTADQLSQVRKLLQFRDALASELTLSQSGMNIQTAENAYIKTSPSIIAAIKRDLSAEIRKLEDELSTLKKQQLARSELDLFLEEEAFFSEGGFVRTSSKKLDKTASVATKEENTKNGTTAPQPAGSTDSQSQTAQPTDSQSNVTETTEVSLAPSTNGATNSAPGDSQAMTAASTVQTVSPAVDVTVNNTQAKGMIVDSSIGKLSRESTVSSSATIETPSPQLINKESSTPNNTQIVSNNLSVERYTKGIQKPGNIRRMSSFVGTDSSTIQILQLRLKEMKDFLKELNAGTVK